MLQLGCHIPALRRCLHRLRDVCTHLCLTKGEISGHIGVTAFKETFINLLQFLQSFTLTNNSLPSMQPNYYLRAMPKGGADGMKARVKTGEWRAIMGWQGPTSRTVKKVASLHINTALTDYKNWQIDLHMPVCVCLWMQHSCSNNLSISSGIQDEIGVASGG